MKMTRLALVVLCILVVPADVAADALATPYALRGLLSPAGHEARAYAISDTGYVVGDFLDPVPWQRRPFRWDHESGMKNLGSLSSNTATAYGVNDAGHVVGHSYMVSGNPHAFRWDDVNGIYDLGTLAGGSAST